MKRQVARKVVLLMGCCMLSATLAMGGCSSSSSTAASLSEQVDGETAMGMVSAVSGNTITLSVSSVPSFDEGKAPSDGQVPENAPSDGEKPDINAEDLPEDFDPSKIQGSDGQTPPEKPSGDDSGNAPSMPSGTEATLTIDDESIIYVQGSDGKETQGSLDDISARSMLNLTIEDGTKVTKIVVSQGMGQPVAPPQSQSS